MKIKATGNMMTACCDTSFLISLYGCDAHSYSAVEYAKHHLVSLSLTCFNRFEFFNALRLSEFRKLLKKDDVTLRQAKFESDIATDFLIEIPCNLTAVITTALQLSGRYVTNEGHRAFDIIHVASAVHLEAETFLTFDKKQKSLATNLGLSTPL